LRVDRCPASERSFDSSSHIIAQSLRSLQCFLNPNNFHLAGRDLSGGFAVTSRSHQAALVTGQHASKDRHRTLLWLRMRTAKADQSLRTMLSSGQSAQVRAHIAQVAARREGGPFLRGRVFQTVIRRLNLEPGRTGMRNLRMRRHFCWMIFCLSVVTAASNATLHGRTDQVDDQILTTLASHQYDLENEGRNFLLNEAENSQFFLLGERHREKEIPALLRVLWPEMWRQGYRHIGAELSPWASPARICACGERP
jgi:hypothetical protein